MFLGLFSYTVLFEFKYEFIETMNATNRTSVSMGGFQIINSKIKISFYEIILSFWIISFIVEELRQV